MAGRIPLVKRPKAPALPLDERITHLTGLTIAPAGASHHDLVARACGVLNYAALIASDAGLPDLAADLCWRQHRIFTGTRHLTGDIAVMSLMPLINVSRLLTRDGDGHAAYHVLSRLYRAAQKRGTANVHGNVIDFAALISTDADHRKICQELWVTLLVDGARALARIGRWTKAAEAMTAHRGIGNRLLDGRQILIMSLMERGLDEQARSTIETTRPTEKWENAVAALLRVHCRPDVSAAPQPEVDLALQEAAALLAQPDAATAAFQARVGLAALDLVRDRTGSPAVQLCDAIADVVVLDAHAARDVLHHDAEAVCLSPEQRQQLDAVLTAAGLGTGDLPPPHMQALADAVDEAEKALRNLL
ncbi:hypothetical protein [Streptomyces sp. NPDC059786]|uniref:hypothetical protein n=1 Tax=Streptomyces sp. NPDC059786 TaxID=3346946 RepID=UPI003648C2B7